MASTPASSAPYDRSEIDRRGQRKDHEPRVEKAERRESFGPVTLTRHVKGDGRTLILYTHGEREQA